jgi:hypothetical protein
MAVAASVIVDQQVTFIEPVIDDIGQTQRRRNDSCSECMILAPRTVRVLKIPRYGGEMTVIELVL